MYLNQIISSYERAIGQELLADELASLCYWNVADPEHKGYLDMKGMEFLLGVRLLIP